MKLNCEKGLTLIELVISLSIIVIISSFIMSSFSFAERRQLHNYAVGLQADIRYAQNMAMQEGTRYSILFLVQNNTYILRRIEKGTYRTVKQVTFENVDIVGVTAVNNTISFTPRGTTGNPSTIILNSDNYGVILTVSLGAGRVLIGDITKI